MLRLQRQGRIGTFGPIRGHEAAVLGSVYALRATDWMVPYYREWPAYMWRGWPLENLILYYAGYAEGMRVPDGVRDLPLCIPIASQIPHAVGLACASRYKGEDSVTMVYFGDGATSHGDCQEAMNFAGVFQAPLVFFCLNNQWAISLPRAKQTHARTLAQKAIAYGFPGIQVDGNDLLACYVATREAVDRARRGERADAGRGPDVPAVAPHHGGRPDEVPRARPRSRSGRPGSPSPGSGGTSRRRASSTPPGQAALEAEIDAEIRSAVERAEARMQANLVEVFEHVYAEPTQELRAQREELLRELAATGEAAHG